MRKTLLSPETLERVRAAIISTDIDRDALLVSIDYEVTSTLPKYNTRAAQIKSDLHSLNLHRFSSGNTPLETWLYTARSYSTALREQYDVFQRALREVGDYLLEFKYTPEYARYSSENTAIGTSAYVKKVITGEVEIARSSKPGAVRADAPPQQRFIAPIDASKSRVPEPLELSTPIEANHSIPAISQPSPTKTITPAVGAPKASNPETPKPEAVRADAPPQQRFIAPIDASKSRVSEPLKLGTPIEANHSIPAISQPSLTKTNTPAVGASKVGNPETLTSKASTRKYFIGGLLVGSIVGTPMGVGIAKFVNLSLPPTPVIYYDGRPDLYDEHRHGPQDAIDDALIDASADAPDGNTPDVVAPPPPKPTCPDHMTLVQVPENRTIAASLTGDFCIHTTEVTLADYKKCTQDFKEKGCKPAVSSGVPVPDEVPNCIDETGQSGSSNRAVNCVTWTRAKSFCTSYGWRLPTAQEWEYAATNGRHQKYPWGDQDPLSRNFSRDFCWKANKKSQPCDVHESKDDVNSLGIEGMAANVQEWVDAIDQQGGKFYPLKGGHFGLDPFSAQSEQLKSLTVANVSAGASGPDQSSNTTGFRCASDPLKVK